MRSRFVAAVASAAGLLASVRGFAAPGGVPVDPGHRVSAAVDPPEDSDTYVILLGEGSLLSVDLRATAGSDLLPVLSLVSPGGTEADLSASLRGEGTARVSVRKILIQDTGPWTVVVSGESGTTGAYGISFATKNPKKRSYKGAVVPKGGSMDFPALGDDGSSLSFTLVEKDGPPVSSVGVVNPAGAPVSPATGEFPRRGSRVVGRKVRLTEGLGSYAVRVGGSPEGDTTVQVVVAVKFPKQTHARVRLGPEPRPSSVSPGVGRDGVVVTVSGEAFVPGARVYFGGTEASSVEVVSPSEIRCPAPDGSESRTGATADVAVVNPDGQANAVHAGYRYLGPPVLYTLDPDVSPVAGGLAHTLTGGGFRPGFTVSVDGAAIAGAVLTPSGAITFDGPAHPAGSANVTVTDEFGRTGALPGAITYLAPPRIQGASPDSASFTGGRVITVTGTGFREGIEVLFDGTPLTDVTREDETEIRFPMPAGTAGAFDLEVVDEVDQSAVAEGLLRRRGPFVDGTSSAVPSAPEGTDFFARTVAVGDIDADGAPDLLLATPYPGYDDVNYVPLPGSRILRNDGSGVFADETSSRHAAFSYGGDYGQAAFAALGDLDGNSGDEAVLSLARPLTDYDYVFTASNGNRYAYYYVGYSYNYRDYRTYPATRVLSNDGSGNLSDGTASNVASSGSTPLFGTGERWQARAGQIGDLDGDGDLDLVLVAGGVFYGTVSGSSYYGGVTYLQETGWGTYVSSTRVLRNGRAGSFSAIAGALPAPTRMPSPYPAYIAEDFDGSAAALGDLDGDGDLDLVLARSYPRWASYYNYTTYYTTYYTVNATRVLTNDGTGKFSLDKTRIPAGYGLTHKYSLDYWQADAVALGDLDGDGDLDLVLGRSPDLPVLGYYYYSNSSYWYDGNSYTWKLESAVRILSNDGSGKFKEDTEKFLPASSFRTGSADTILGVRSIQIGDLDGDRSPDLVLSGGVYAVYDSYGTGYGYYGILPAGPAYATRLLLNDGAGRFKDVTKDWLPSPANGDQFQADAAILGDLDGDGGLDLVLAAGFNPYYYGVTSGTNRPLRIFRNQ